MNKITCGIYLYSMPRAKILACHATSSRWNNWSIPKGLKEDDEDIFPAAERELFEETAIDLKKIAIIGKHPLPRVKYKKQNKILESFLVITTEKFETHEFVCHTLVNNTFPEIDKWKWITVGEAMNVLHETQQENIPLVQEMIARLP